MKNRTIVLICLLVIGGSCQLHQRAESESEVTPAISPYQPVNSSPEPKVVDTAKFISVEIKRTDRNEGSSLDISVEYPQLSKPYTAGERAFNQFVKKHVDDQLKDFRKFLINRERDGKQKGDGMREFEINLDYTVDYYSERLTSVVMNWNGYTGGLNYDYFPSTITYDLQQGHAIELKDLFDPGAKYLDNLSKLSIGRLQRTCLSCGCDGVNPGEPLPEGKINAIGQGGPFDLAESASAKEENFDGWSITPEGLKITFDEYQVGPGCIGIIHIVLPYSELKPDLRDDLVLAAPTR